MTLAHIQVHSSVIPEYIYDFPESAQRSVQGSVHFRPGTVFLTEDELRHIETDPKFTHLKGRFQVVSRPSGEVTEAAQPSSEPVPAPVPELPSDKRPDLIGGSVLTSEGGTLSEKKSKFRPQG